MTPSSAMASDLWTHQFCLSCDKQLQLDGAAYCSESCRLADQEKASSPALQSSSPDDMPSPSEYPLSATTARSTSSHSRPKFYLSPAYDFSNARPYGNATIQSQILSGKDTVLEPDLSSTTYNRTLSPSSSHSSLCSMRSTSSTGEPKQISATAKQELKAYAISFENVRLQRRRSY